MSALPLPAGPEPSAFCSTSHPARIPRPRPGRLGIPEVVVVVVVVLAFGNRPVPAALVVVAAAVADLIAGRRPNGPASRPSRRRNR
ncbi:hypothetical protein [Streptomyces sp. NPDC046197]|uniref:hypothetical protein n=1 Tax=Streptomyces sp. NPDC046197 TaxID=3154337 RepID=UPI0033E3D6DB